MQVASPVSSSTSAANSAPFSEARLAKPACVFTWVIFSALSGRVAARDRAAAPGSVTQRNDPGGAGPNAATVAVDSGLVGSLRFAHAQ
ncbi:MAG: hypothetical protein IPJ34_38590 [Myxococcales bacterium]|nr:hypothetical protein [Myxococcales bacterium]